MGDRTYVVLSIPTELVKLFEISMGEDAPKESYKIDELTDYHYEEVNYGELDFLPELVKLGIAYTSSWESGDEFVAGSDHLRFTNLGEVIRKEVTESDNSIDLLELVQITNRTDCSTEEQLELLKSLVKRQQEKLLVMSWDDQVKFGKMYRAKHFVTNGEINS